MIADNLLLFLEQPEKLNRVSYQELKTLVMEHPYFAHAHQLLLYKSKLTAHKDYVHDLNRAAVHSIDRGQLRLKLRQLDIATQPPEEVDGLPIHEQPAKELPELYEKQDLPENNILPIPPEPVEEPPLTAPPTSATTTWTTQPAPDPVQIPALEPTETEEYVLEEQAPEQLSWTFSPTPTKEIESHKESAAPPVPEPLDKNSFRTWHRRPGITIPFQPSNQLHVGQQPEQHKTTAAQDKPSEQPDYNQQAAASVLENTAIISASLADLLAKQGHTEKAAEMYARLCLIFPEKSTYFAAQIEKLKK